MNGLAPMSFELTKPARLLSQSEMEIEEKNHRLKEAFSFIHRTLSPQLAAMSSQQMKTLVSARFVPAITGWKPNQGNLILLGNTGAGKSVSAAFIYKRFILSLAGQSDNGLSEAMRIRWFTARAIGIARKEENLGRVVDTLEKAKRAKLLIIDDVGQDNNREDFFDIMDHRYFRGHPTLITSGLTMEALEKRYGSELWRRMTFCANKRAIVVEDWSKR